MPTSISIRQISQLKIPEGETVVERAGVPLGSIRRSETTFIINSESYTIYNCSFSKDYADNISVFIPEIDDYIELNSYKKKIEFKLYYNSHKGIIFSDATTPITKSFLNCLNATPSVNIEYKTPHFNLESIANQLIETKGVGFDSDDEGVSSKSFYGSEVDTNQEASYALEQDHSTKLIGSIEVLGSLYTIMFTQSGSIVAYSKIPTTKEGKPLENPMLHFSLDVLSTIHFLD
ncbi:hypothetical protein [Weissella soli]|uniref:Uncharacterized protein n=1 Tax=Weissella soli TaxID=155866 RepID=A0A288QN56_9LACO|nr:hypothetical protein [Weissella soli]AOT56596.1 hypothetical protein WSWS_00965 [Weissella soli]NKY83048.1 hypothetical protein [Weissella soli]RDL12161.1 hypothetical protein DFP99_0594 [Weissella soli]GEN92602.1 hypothetical protein WSO01_02140 [Weissella soli]